MKILQICNKPPLPPVDGGCIAMNAITEGLLEEKHSVRVFSIATDKHPFLPEQIDKTYLKETEFESIYIDTSIKIPEAFMNLFSKESYNIKRFYSPLFEKKLVEILKKETFDIIHLESLYITPYLATIRKYSNAKIILRAHNVEHEIWSRLAENTNHPLKSLYLGLLSKRLESYESQMINKVDGIAAITDVDAMHFKEMGAEIPIVSIPLSIKTKESIPTGNEADPLSIFYLGSFDWLPNREGIKWFLNKIWPHLSEHHPGLKLYIAGRNMPPAMKKIDLKNVEITGEVENAADFMLSKSVMIVPLLSGSGIRVKIIEAMSLGKTIISTDTGAEGINYTDGENILIANTPLEFAKGITKCLEDTDFALHLGNNAKELVKSYYSREMVTEKLVKFYTEI